jgi:ERCC4-type nuclease
MKLNHTQVKLNGLKPVRVPEGFGLIVDSREKRPLFGNAPDGMDVATGTLHHGDYSIRGFEDIFAIERKQISDFYSYIGRERDRTVKKMEEFREIMSAGGFAGLVIEASEGDLLAGYLMSRVSPEVARQALVSFEVRYGVHCYYSKSRRDIERWIMDRAVKFYKVMREVRRGTKTN